MRCFVMMPFAAQFDLVKETIREAVTTAGLEHIRADELQPPGRITSQIVDEIERSDICVGDLTGQNPNVVWEVGYAMARRKPLVPIAQSADDLFFDLNDYRTIVYSSHDLPVSLKQRLISALTAAKQQIREMPIEPFYSSFPHPGLTQVVGAKRIADTPFGFFDIVGTAKDSVFLAAQNHFFFAETPQRKADFETAVFEFLRKDDRRHFEIMLCSPNHQHAVQTWQYVTRSRYKDDLEKSVDFFRSLRKSATAAGYSRERLVIRCAEFVPLSITFLDPEHPDGRLVLVPNAYEEKNRVRPCFALSRKNNDDIFQQYWGAFWQRFNDTGNEEI